LQTLQNRRKTKRFQGNNATVRKQKRTNPKLPKDQSHQPLERLRTCAKKARERIASLKTRALSSSGATLQKKRSVRKGKSAYPINLFHSSGTRFQSDGGSKAYQEKKKRGGRGEQGVKGNITWCLTSRREGWGKKKLLRRYRHVGKGVVGPGLGRRGDEKV